MDIEELVLRMNSLANQRSQCSNSKEMTVLRKSEAKLYAQALEKGEEMKLWQLIGGLPADGVSRDALDAMLADEPPPWGSQGMHHTALRLQHGRLLFMTYSDLSRCEEELALLPVEMLRLRNWVSFMLNEAQGVIDELDNTPLPSVFGLDHLPSISETVQVHAHAHPSNGKRFCLALHMVTLKQMQHDIQAALGPLLPL